MRHIQKSFVLIFIFYLFSTSYANNVTSNLSSLLQSVHSMQANFTQTIYDDHGRVVLKSYGEMALERPGKFRWQVARPVPQLIIANASRMWIYDPDLKQLTIRSLKDIAGEVPALLLSHPNAVLNRGFIVKTLQKGPTGWQWFALVPRHRDGMFSLVKLGFMNGQLRTMWLQDQLGHSTSIQFEHIKANHTLPSDMFSFKQKRNVDVIDETRS